MACPDSSAKVHSIFFNLDFRFHFTVQLHSTFQLHAGNRTYFLGNIVPKSSPTSLREHRVFSALVSPTETVREENMSAVCRLSPMNQFKILP